MSKIAIIVEPDKNHNLLYKAMVDTVGFTMDEIFEVAADPQCAEKVFLMKPLVIMPIGEKALNFFLGVKGITKYAGQIAYKNDIPVVPILAPGYIERNPHQLRRFAEDIYTAYQAASGVGRIEAINQYIILEDIETAQYLVDYIKDTGYCSFDFETTLLTDMGTFDPNFRVTSLSISFQQGSSYVIPIDHHERTMSDETLKEILNLLNHYIFADDSITKLGHNVKFDMHCAARIGITKFKGPFHDTMLMHHLIYQDTSHKLKDLVREYYPRFANYEQEISKYSWDTIPLAIQAKYNALDSDVTLRLYWLFTEMLLEDDARLYNIYRNEVAPTTKALFYMEERGMLIHKKYLMESITSVEGLIAEVEEEMRKNPKLKAYDRYLKDKARTDAIYLYEEKLEKEGSLSYKSKSAQANQETRLKKYEELIAGLKAGTMNVDNEPVNFASPTQLIELLFSKEGFNFVPPRDPRSGNPIRSTNKDTLDLINDKSGFLDNLQAYRQLKQILSTYLVSILDKLDANHRIHASFNQHGTGTGRLSASKPNLQNVITRTKYKKVEEAVKFVKKAFIVPEGYIMLQADYSQAELRLIAYYANERNMLRAYNNGEDLHELTAANARGYTLEQFGVLPLKDQKQFRFEAKAENFGFIYGISPLGFQSYARVQYGIKMSIGTATKKRAKFFEAYPGLLEYHKIYIAKARKYKYVRTFFGRKVHIPDIDSYNSIKRGHAERNAINAPIQGSAGEFTIFALALLEHRLGPEIHVNNTVHDNLIFYCLDSIDDQVLADSVAIIKETMENLPLLQYFGKELDKVVMKADFEISRKSWGELEEYKT